MRAKQVSSSSRAGLSRLTIAERVFVITMMDVVPDTTKPNEQQSNIFDLAINNKSWPYTERLAYIAGDTVRWRWLNGG